MAHTAEHVIFGLRGMGKSTLGLTYFQEQPGAKVWWDPNGDQKVPAWAAEADPSSDRFAIEETLRRGRAVVFHAKRDRFNLLNRDLARKQVLWLLGKCIKHRAGLWIDECHLVYPEGHPLEELEDAARSARHLEITLCMMSTEMQATDKSIMQMGAVVHLFKIGFSGPWLNRYKIPPEAVAAMEAMADHEYITIPPGQPGKWSGPHRLPESRLSRLYR